MGKKLCLIEINDFYDWFLYKNINHLTNIKIIKYYIKNINILVCYIPTTKYYQWSTVVCQLSTVNCQVSSVNRQSINHYFIFVIIIL